MTTLTVMYPAAGTHFDRAYYREVHIPLVKARWGAAGLGNVDIVFGDEALGGGAAAYHCIATLHFDSREALDAAVGGPAAAEVFGDIPKFTDATAAAVIGSAG